jgi:hypothetical protein
MSSETTTTPITESTARSRAGIPWLILDVVILLGMGALYIIGGINESLP